MSQATATPVPTTLTPTSSPEGLRSQPPPTAAAIRTALCAVCTLAGWALGDREAAVAAFVLAYLAGGEAGGVLGLADQVRPEAASALAALRALGVRQAVLLTGDHEGVAHAVAEQVGADDVRAGLLPDQKVIELRRLADAGHTLAMVGDGVNDAPALATAPVGVAMGGAGTDVALEVADVVLMRDDLRALPFAVWLGRRARTLARQNMLFAFTVIGLLVTSSLLGLPLWLGVVGHEGSTLLVVLNGLRLLWERPPAPGVTAPRQPAGRPAGEPAPACVE